jgi:hypothetical protein
MSDSFVVSSGGSINGGGDPITLSGLSKPLSFAFPAYPYVKNAFDTGFKVPKIAAIAVVLMIINITLIIFLIVGMQSVMNSKKTSDGIGAANTRTIRMGGPIGIPGSIQGMKNGVKRSGKFDTFFGGIEPPVQNNAPADVTHNWSRMNDALEAYSKLQTSGESTPDWAEYWNDWQMGEQRNTTTRHGWENTPARPRNGPSRKVY